MFSWVLLIFLCVLITGGLSSSVENLLISDDLIQQLKEDPMGNLIHLYDYIVDDMLYSFTNESCGSDWAVLGEQQQTVKLIGDKGMTCSKQTIAADSFGKPQPGFLRGNVKYMGNFDECISIVTDTLDFSMQYCQLSVKFNITNRSTFPITLTEALCVPDSCTAIEFGHVLQNISSVLKLFKVPVALEMSKFVCTPQKGVEFSPGAIVMIIISCLFLALSVLATMVDLSKYIYQYLNNEHCDTSINGNGDSLKLDFHESDTLLGTKHSNRFTIFLNDVVEGFSLYKTVPAVLSTQQPAHAITCINGMRVISMCWVMLCHTYIFILFQQDFANTYDILTWFVGRFSSQPITNGFFSVDSFFFLSGLLVAYLTFRQMKRSNGRFPFFVYYIHRILRLTPTYMFVLFFYWYLTVHLGNGPQLASEMGPGSLNDKVCRSYWWTNLLYINNFHPSNMNNECMGWAWYLANDMQFHVFAPLVLIPLYYWFPSGIIALCVTLLSSIGVTGFIAGYYGYSANIIESSFESPPPTNLPSENDQIYAKPYCRISPYIVGIFLGYLLYKRFRLPVRNYFIGWIAHVLLWILAIVLGIVNVYGLYSSWHDHTLSSTENVLYYMFSRFTWGVTLALVVFVCHNGYGGVINRFLSLPIWIPLSRMTFNVYLVHEMIMILLFSELRQTYYYTDATMCIHFISIVVLSYGAAAVISVFVEYPLSNLETAIFKLFGVQLHSSTRRVVDKPSPRDVNSPLETAVRIG